MRLSPDLHADLSLMPIDNAVLASQQRIMSRTCAGRTWV